MVVRIVAYVALGLAAGALSGLIGIGGGVGFALGSLFGARVAVGLSDTLLTRVFGVALIAIGLKMAAGR